MAVLGYEPTPAELAAIQRGEDPRAGEDERRETRGNAGESETRDPPKPKEPGFSDDRTPGPSEGTVMRWLDSATLIVEVGLDRETVTLFGEKPLENTFHEQDALDARMSRWTFGTYVRLSYPARDQQGKPVYRDDRGRLIARID